MGGSAGILAGGDGSARKKKGVTKNYCAELSLKLAKRGRNYRSSSPWMQCRFFLLSLTSLILNTPNSRMDCRGNGLFTACSNALSPRRRVIWLLELFSSVLCSRLFSSWYQTRKASGISGEKAAKSDKTWLTPKRNNDAV